MTRLLIAVSALALAVSSVACGGSQAPAKDPSAETQQNPNQDAQQAPPPGAQPPGLGLGGTGTGSAQGMTNGGH